MLYQHRPNDRSNRYNRLNLQEENRHKKPTIIYLKNTKYFLIHKNVKLITKIEYKNVVFYWYTLSIAYISRNSSQIQGYI